MLHFLRQPSDNPNCVHPLCKLVDSQISSGPRVFRLEDADAPFEFVCCALLYLRRRAAVVQQFFAIVATVAFELLGGLQGRVGQRVGTRGNEVLVSACLFGVQFTHRTPLSHLDDPAEHTSTKSWLFLRSRVWCCRCHISAVAGDWR